MNAARDILGDWRITAVAFVLPVLIIVGIGFLNISQQWRAAVWAIGLTVMGGTCVANAVRCGRVHCYLTGPFLLIMAMVALLYGFGIIFPSYKDGWNVIGLLVLVGAAALIWIPEHFFGKYRHLE